MVVLSALVPLTHLAFSVGFGESSGFVVVVLRTFLFFFTVVVVTELLRCDSACEFAGKFKNPTTIAIESKNA